MKKRILITGTSRGIGKAIASTLLDEGHEIIGLGKTHTISHENYLPRMVDLRELELLPKFLKSLQREFPSVDVLICNAGVWHYNHFEELSFEQMGDLINVNFLSHLYLIKTFLPEMKKKKKGDILFLGSESALKHPPKQSVYAASKSAVRSFAKSLRSECATSNIRIGILNPSIVKTEMFSQAPFELDEDESHHILPEDIAAFVSYLLNERPGVVFDEVNLSPQKHRIIKKRLQEESGIKSC